MNGQRQHVFDNKGNVRRVLMALYVISALLAAADLFVHRHVQHPLEAVTGFYALYGFVACVSLVLLARLLRRILKRPEGYYDG